MRRQRPGHGVGPVDVDPGRDAGRPDDDGAAADHDRGEHERRDHGRLRPSTVHDFDGDDKSEYATSSANNYTVYRPTGPTIMWKAIVSDQSGIAAGTAFDFLGDGVAEAMYADEAFMFIFGANGQVLLQIPRTSGTLSEYPIVADIDNDGYVV